MPMPENIARLSSKDGDILLVTGSIYLEIHLSRTRYDLNK